MSRPGRLAPPHQQWRKYQPPDEYRLRGMPSNAGHESDPFGSHLAELSRRNAEALYRAAVGRDLDATVTISAGHKHDDVDSSLLWHQYGSWTFAEDSDNGGREGKLVTATALTDVALIPFSVPDYLCYYVPFWVRFRISNPAPTYATYTTLRLKGQFLTLLGPTAESKPKLDVSLQSSSAKTFSNQWLSFGPYKFLGGDYYLQLQAAVETAGDKAMLWEVQVGHL